MTINAWVAIIGLCVTLLVLLVSAVVWLVRLEGKIAAGSGRTEALERAALTHETTKIEVVRLQEQIKHLTDLIERYFVPAEPKPIRRSRSPPNGG